MKDRILQIAKGQIHSAGPDLMFFPETLRRDVPVKAVIRFDILVKSRNSVPFKGFFYSSDDRVVPSTFAVAGLSGTVGVEIHTENALVGEEISGELQIVSNAGERFLPFSFRVVENESQALMPKSAEEFCELARTRKERAYQVFTSAFFTRLPFMQENGLAGLYEGICRNGRDRHAMEMFLVGGGLKEAVRFEADPLPEPLAEDALGKEQALVLHMSIWGYLRLTVKASESWIRPSVSVVTGDDADENGTITIPFVIDPQELHAGHNYGEIRLTGAAESAAVPVHVFVRSKSSHESRAVRSMEITLGRMLLDYLNMSYEEPMLLAEMDRTVTAYIGQYPANMRLYLFRAWILLQNGQEAEAEAIMNGCRQNIRRKRGENPEDYCVFLFLERLMTSQESLREETAEKIHRYFESYPGFLIALMELFLRHHSTEEEALNYLEDLQASYGNSPFIFAFAARIYRGNPDFMKKESVFALYVFHYMVRHQCLTGEVAENFLGWKNPPRMLAGLRLKSLMLLYRDRKEDAVLQAVCETLIRLGSADRSAAWWYEEGVRKDLKLTSLYDYYLMSLEVDESTQIPEEVLLYFSYGSSMDDDTRIKLYTYIQNHCDKDGSIYREYQDQMNEFALNRLLAGKISPGLVMLYDSVLSPELVDEHLGSVLPNLLYARYIQTSLPFVVNVVVHYPQLMHETVRSLKNGAACIPVYTDNAMIFLEDRLGGRYLDPGLTCVRLMNRPELTDACRRTCPNERMLLLEDTELLYHSQIENEAMYETARILAASDGLQESYRSLLFSRLIAYCYHISVSEKGKAVSRAGDEESTEWLCGIHPEQIYAADRKLLTELYIMRDRMKEAYRMIAAYGFRDIKVSLLLKLTVRYITELVYEYDRQLLMLGRYLLQKEQWNEILLTYMARHYNGTTDELLSLLLLCRKMQAESFDLAERVVAQMMFTGKWERIDEAYACYEQAGQPATYIKTAYELIKCDRYLKKEEPLSERNLRAIENAVREKGADRLPKGYTLALLDRFAGEKELSDSQKHLCEDLVYRMCAAEEYCACFADLKRHIEMPHQMEGRKLVEWRGEENGQVSYSGRILPQDEAVSGLLREIYPGIYTGAFFLFPDERLELTIRMEKEGRKAVEENISVSGDDVYRREGSVYSAIAGELEMWKDGEDDRLYRSVAARERKRRVVSELFELM